MEPIMVSVCCEAFNQEKYIARALDSIIAQKTSFKFEILVHDDASTDGTAEIIRRYADEYPDLINPVIQDENKYSQGVKICWEYQYPRAQGKYIAMCEGDDYWCDEFKLQKQFDKMESNSDANVCTHIVECVNENGDLLNRRFPSKGSAFKGGNLTSDELCKLLLSEYTVFQTSSFFFRKSALNLQSCIPVIISESDVGDVPLMLLLASSGGLIFIPEVMSRYTFERKGSWTGSIYFDDASFIKHNEAMINTVNNFNVLTHCLYSDETEKSVNELMFRILLRQNNYKELIKPRFITRFKEFTLKKRLYVRFKYYLKFIKK